MSPLLLLPLLLLGLGVPGRASPGAPGPVSALRALVSSGNGSLARGTVASLVGIAARRAQCRVPCGACVSADAVLALAGGPAALEPPQLPWLAAVVIVTLRDPPGGCGDPWAARVRALHRDFTGGHGERGLRRLMADVGRGLGAGDGAQGCVDAPGVLAAGDAVSPRVGDRGARVLVALATLVLSGRCLWTPPPPPGFFLDYVFSRYGDNRGIPPQGLSALMEQLGLGPPGDTPGDTPGDRDSSSAPPALPHGQSQRWDTLCLPPPELLRALGVPAGVPLSRGDFLRLGPALLQQQLSGACAPPPGPHPPTGPPTGPPGAPRLAPAGRDTVTATVTVTATATVTGSGSTSTTDSDGLSTAQRYLVGTAAGLSLCLCPVLALALLRCPPCHRAQRWLSPLLLGLAAGALSGDALLHLLPQVLGLHEHSAGEHADAGVAPTHEEGGEEPPWRLVAVLGGLFAFFLLEKIVGILLPAGGAGGAHCDHAVGLQRRQEAPEPQPGDPEQVKVEDTTPTQSTQELQTSGPRALPALVTLGRGAHALADGLALGAAGSASWRSGVATALGLLCHELPAALGLVSVLLQLGLGTRRALALALAGSVPVLPGLFAGLALGSGAAGPWIGAVATGLLLHLALGDMVPAMLSSRSPRPWAVLALQSAGLLVGWALLLLLALYEDNIRL
ncbi:zinc transporter ZIP4 [Columba livia]|uniref:zinc transporter ZIP4 n=1 Tax=Columba livia TaxID=8932 RepID=UPI0031BADEE5